MGTAVKSAGAALDGDVLSDGMLLEFSNWPPKMTNYCVSAFPVKPSAYRRLVKMHSLLLWST